MIHVLRCQESKLMNIIKCLLKSSIIFLFELFEDSDTTRQLLRATFNLYQSSHIMCGTKKMLMVFFSSLAFPEHPDVSR